MKCATRESRALFFTSPNMGEKAIAMNLYNHSDELPKS